MEQLPKLLVPHLEGLELRDLSETTTLLSLIDVFLLWLLLRTKFPTISTREASTLPNTFPVNVPLEYEANQPTHFQGN